MPVAKVENELTASDLARLTGRLFVRNSQGAGEGWTFHFTNAFADDTVAWTIMGPLHWTGNRAELGMSSQRNNCDTIMAIEMVK